MLDPETPSSPRDGGIQSIARAAAVLRALERSPSGMSLGEIAAALDLPRSTIQRIVDALKDEGFLIRASPRGGVRLGPMLLRLAGLAEHASAKRIRPLIADLSHRLRETVDVSTLQGGAAVFVDQATGRQRLVAQSAIGERFPLSVTAPGKALLALLDPAHAQAALTRSLKEFPAWPLDDSGAFWAEIEACRVRGYAFDEESHSPGIAAVGVAFMDPDGLPLMISVPSPAQRFRNNRERFARDLLRTKREAERLLKRDRDG